MNDNASLVSRIRTSSMTWSSLLGLRAAVLPLVLICWSCADYSTDEKITTRYDGVWVLASSSDPIDSGDVGTAAFELRHDSTFTCTSSFFWRKDSLRGEPCLGRWATGTVYRYFPMSHHGDPNKDECIKITVGREVQYWLQKSAGRETGKLIWSTITDSTCYTWVLKQ